MAFCDRVVFPLTVVSCFDVLIMRSLTLEYELRVCFVNYCKSSICGLNFFYVTTV